MRYKERNYSRFRQFSERFFGKSIMCRTQNHQCKVGNIILTNIIMFEKEKQIDWVPFQNETKD